MYIFDESRLRARALFIPHRTNGASPGRVQRDRVMPFAVSPVYYIHNLYRTRRMATGGMGANIRGGRGAGAAEGALESRIDHWERLCG